MKKSKSWFDTDKNGFRQLYSGRKKSYVVKELTQNAWDETITFCKIDIKFVKDINKKDIDIIIKAEDDSATGFRDKSHAYTLFAETYKRYDPTKRGRFNLGEKQALSICHYGVITTTTGSIVFNEEGRFEPESDADAKELGLKEWKRDRGTVVELHLKATEEEYVQMVNEAHLLFPPKGVKYTVNDMEVPFREVHKSFKASLSTIVWKGDKMIGTSRMTQVDLIEPTDKSYIYEGGIPVVETDCPWSINVHQKIPVTFDRDNIKDPVWLKDLYAVVLNKTFNEIPDVSSPWVHMGLSRKGLIKKDTATHIAKEKFGDKWVTFNPNDPGANDRAIQDGAHIVYPGQTPKEVMDMFRQHDLVHSSTEQYGQRDLALAKMIQPTEAMKRFRTLCQKIGREFLGFDIEVKFMKAPEANVMADYGGRVLRFNVSKLSKTYFDKVTKANMNLVVHEIPHEYGWHTDKNYLNGVTRLAGFLIIKMRDEPDYFEVYN